LQDQWGKAWLWTLQPAGDTDPWAPK
jgi:hypothetical protein